MSYYCKFGKRQEPWNDAEYKQLRDSAGIRIKADPTQLVDQVLVHPQAATWFKELVIRHCVRTGLKKDLVQSSALEGTLR